MQQVNNNDNTAEKIFLGLILLISPLFALPLILKKIYYRQRYAFIYFSIFCGLFAYLTIPFADLWRHTVHYFSYANYQFADIIDDFAIHDYFLPVVSWFLNNLNIPFDYLRLFELIECVLIMSYAFNDMIDNSTVEYSNKDIWVRYVIMLLFFKFIITIASVRFGFACFQYVFAYYLLYNKQNKLGFILFLLFSITIHNSFLYFGLLAEAIRIFNKSKVSSWIIVLIGSLVVGVLLQKYSYLLGVRADWYFGEGSDISGGGYAANMTMNGFILAILPRVFVVPFMWLAYRNMDLGNKWVNLCISWSILGLVFISNPFVLMRIIQLIGKMAIFVFLAIEFASCEKISNIKLYVICGLLFVFASCIDNRKYFMYSRYEQLALPIPYILSNYYEEQWVLSHVDGNTILIKD